MERILLIESGGRHVLEGFLPRFLASQPEVRETDVVTCYAGEPQGFDVSSGKLWRVTDYGGRAGRQRLTQELRERRHGVIAILCSGEPIMTKWKWMLGARLPAKILIVNENSDYFWCDYTNWKTIRHFFLFRAGLTGAGAVRLIGGLLLFPFTITYLAAYTALVHLRRKVRT